MTEERSCTLRGVPVLARAYLQGVDAGTDMLALMQAVPEAPHPDFAARAAIWREQRAGLISLKEAQRRSAAVGTVPTTSQTNQSGQGRGGVPRPPVARPRHERPSPNDSRQYAQPMATTAARDDRLTPNAKAFLQVLRARCGKGRETSITKGTAGNIMARSTRTIRRYLVDLVRFGYVELEILRNGRGLHLGLTVKLTALVAPFYEEARGLARWLAETPLADFRPFQATFDPMKGGVTLLSSKNQNQIISSSASLKSAGTSRFAARGRLSRRMGARSAPPV
ncbi:helix-turn-helix domain-containing protein [Aureimonas altamirensis]|uniref:helix-turn-helix domain-containing protein n=1 Tax=Aureimonas altamirensis TaxID=370622 RepID=UPI002553E89E|nr:helix-turn-helix domain-containing protein [Aureimonas altamirensis]